MRSLTLKLALAFLAVGLAGVVLVAVIVRRQTMLEFDRFIVDQYQAEVIARAGGADEDGPAHAVEERRLGRFAQVLRLVHVQEQDVADDRPFDFNRQGIGARRCTVVVVHVALVVFVHRCGDHFTAGVGQNDRSPAARPAATARPPPAAQD